MNILFFLHPKNEIAFIYNDDTLRQAIEKMEFHQYSAVPILDKEGHYVGTLTEGDLLWGIKNRFGLCMKKAEELPITSLARRLDNEPVHANSNMEDLIEKALNQNFVPVVDDAEHFIGLITRKDIIRYCYSMSKTNTLKEVVQLV